MRDEAQQSDEQGQLVMRGYRRHRKHSRWGLIALICPAVVILWAMFWYLMMNQIIADPNAAPEGHHSKLIYSMVGCLAFTSLGIGMSLVGLMDRRTRHHLASAGLTVNLVALMVLGILILFGAF